MVTKNFNPTDETNKSKAIEILKDMIDSWNIGSNERDELIESLRLLGHEYKEVIYPEQTRVCKIINIKSGNISYTKSFAEAMNLFAFKIKDENLQDKNFHHFYNESPLYIDVSVLDSLKWGLPE